MHSWHQNWCWMNLWTQLHGNDSGSGRHARKIIPRAKVRPHRMLFQQMQSSIKTMFSNWSRTATIQLMPMLKPITAALNKNISWCPSIIGHTCSIILSIWQQSDHKLCWYLTTISSETALAPERTKPKHIEVFRNFCGLDLSGLSWFQWNPYSHKRISGGVQWHGQTVSESAGLHACYCCPLLLAF